MTAQTHATARMTPRHSTEQTVSMECGSLILDKDFDDDPILKTLGSNFETKPKQKMTVEEMSFAIWHAQFRSEIQMISNWSKLKIVIEKSKKLTWLTTVFPTLYLYDAYA